MNLSDQGAFGGVAADAIIGGISPPHTAPDVSMKVDAQAVGEPRSEIISEHSAVPQASVDHVEDADMRRAAVRYPAVDDIQPRFVRRQSQAIGPHEIVSDHIERSGGIQSVDSPGKLGFLLDALIVAVDAVPGVGEPHRTVRGHNHVIWRAEAFPLIPVRQDGDGPVQLGASNSSKVLTADKAPIAIAGMPIRIIRRVSKYPQVSIRLEPAINAVVWNIAEEKTTIVPEVDRSLHPSKARCETFDRCVSDLVREPSVERFDALDGISQAVLDWA
ncbi:hypothetical protein XH88_18035 [Bradyrhizobium sp. CCBAU 51627]|nr:hypothetical protein [Bradyrhizobium sp. CCBAU 51627]